jgi:hypothetical protein
LLKKPESAQETAAAAGWNVQMNTDLPHWRQSLYAKHQYIRSKKLLKLVAELDCQACGSGQMVQAAHTNWGGGKGRGVKADDNLVAALCLKCHFEVDQGKDLTKDERQLMWYLAHNLTVAKLCEQGKWPADVPVPTMEAQLS